METVLITGATDGIGRETARQLLLRGYRVLVHGRTSGKAEAVAKDLMRATHRAEVEPVCGDLSSMDEVIELGRQVRAKAHTIDVLINNAGVYEPVRRFTCDGFETTMAVNHFAPFLLTVELLDKLRRAEKGRVITLSSSAHEKGRLKEGDSSFATELEGYNAYASSKLANVLFTVELSKRVRSSSVKVYSVDPGVVTTKLLHVGWGITGDPVEQGAATSVYLATAKGLEDMSGAYFSQCRRTEPSPMGRDSKLAHSLWDTSAMLLSNCRKHGLRARQI